MRHSHTEMNPILRRLAERCVVFFDTRQANATEVSETVPGASASFELDELSCNHPLLALAVCEMVLNLDETGYSKDSLQAGMLVHILNWLPPSEIDFAVEYILSSSQLRAAVSGVWARRLEGQGEAILRRVSNRD